MEPQSLKRSEKFAIGLFGIMATLIVVPGLVLAAVSIVSTGSIDLSHDLSF